MQRCFYSVNTTYQSELRQRLVWKFKAQAYRRKNDKHQQSKLTGLKRAKLDPKENNKFGK